jgi:hypothetical protein
MKRIDEVFEYDGFNIHVFSGLPNSADLNWDEEISFKISKPNNNMVSGKLILRPLWYIDEDERDDTNFDYKNNYQNGDYFQQTFKTDPTREGIGTTLHDFIIKNRNEFSIKNVFSTKKTEDIHDTSENANDFWLKRIKVGKAIFDTSVYRYKILFDLNVKY